MADSAVDQLKEQMIALAKRLKDLEDRVDKMDGGNSAMLRDALSE
jgi:hypothetical protein